MKNFIIQTFFNGGVLNLYQVICYKFLPLFAIHTLWSWQSILFILVAGIASESVGLLHLRESIRSYRTK